MIATPAACGSQAAIQLKQGDELAFGGQRLKALHTPGHTAGSMSYWLNGESSHVFTGDTLLINGCGRTDFQSGSAAALHHSITQVLFALPEDTAVWPGHDYKGQTQSSIAHEKRHNTRLLHSGVLRSEAQFVALMNGLQLPAPRRMHEAVPANLMLGLSKSGSNTAQHPQHAAYPNRSDEPVPAMGYAGDVLPQLAWHWVRSGEAVLIDVRSDAERAWVGFVSEAKIASWKLWPGMLENSDFDAALLASASTAQKVVLLCRSGLRSIPAAKRATLLGFEAYNILEGFEGDPNPQAHRNTLGGWRVSGLPWKQH